MEHKTGTFATYDGLNLYYQAWLPEETPRAAIAFFHGGGGHSGQPTYTYFTKYFAEKGYAVYGLDQRGFGRSEGDTYHIERIQDVVKTFEPSSNWQREMVMVNLSLGWDKAWVERFCWNFACTTLTRW